eukprot:g2846.t1
MTSAHSPCGVQFRFYTDDEIRRISVKEVTSPVAYDTLGHAVKNGLHDPAFGPDGTRAPRCETCGLGFSQCPGHLGHIELSVPLYNPLLFNHTYKLLRSKCWHCHKFKIDQNITRIFAAKISLIDAGLLTEAKCLDTVLNSAGEFGEDAVKRSERVQNILDEVERKVRCRPKKPLHVHARMYRRELISQFLKSIPTQKCANCSAINSSLRKEGFLKIFRKKLAAKQQRQMRKLGMETSVSALQKSENGKGSLSLERGENESDNSDDNEEEKGVNQNYVPALEAIAQLRCLWQEESSIIHMIMKNVPVQLADDSSRTPFVPSSKSTEISGADQLFLRVLPVPPPRFRPAQVMGGEKYEHLQNVMLTKVLNLNYKLLGRESTRYHNGEMVTSELTFKESVDVMLAMQEAVNCFMDSSKARQTAGNSDVQNGVRQLLEKKEGLFRKNMMGKRVNYAARSVISPDPMIGTHEIGVPEKFARSLSYPEPVTPWNVAYMRTLVRNGAKVHPGALFVEDERGRKTDLSRLDRAKREALAKTLLTKPAGGNIADQVVGKRVWRHLRTGDAVLMNRQPTLHKPSIMCHHVRVLHNTNQVIRMHYANCNTYNADFDGDEINLHFPQNELARAEAYNIAGTAHQYTSCKDGAPLRGLIQDHVDMAVLLTKCDTFLSRDHYQQLVYGACDGGICRDNEGVEVAVETVVPAILKSPHGPLWTGKQVVSSVFRQLLRNVPPFNLTSKSKVSGKCWSARRGLVEAKKDVTLEASAKRNMAPDKVLFRDNDLLRGVLDKAQIGSSSGGVVHGIFELYGPSMASKLLTGLGRLLTVCLKQTGHTCGMDDLILTKEAETDRLKKIEKAPRECAKTLAEFVGLPTESNSMEAMQAALKKKLLDDNSGTSGAELDSAMQGVAGKQATGIIDACIPDGQYKRFPENKFSLMVLSGAKGSKVNHSQISCCLGQQALEGRRVPRMPSGKTLPSFAPFDPAPRADGFISDRFLTGVRPQDYFFHCMAGREGLVDTAVKTSRSGYLQRCLVKHLEDLRVHYDQSVRDSDGNIVQFLYGEDGIDVSRAAFLSGDDAQLSFLAQNYRALLHKYNLHDEFFQESGLSYAEATKMHRMLAKTKTGAMGKGSIIEGRRPIGEKAIKAGKTAEDVMQLVQPGWHRGTITKVRGGGVFDIKWQEDNKVTKKMSASVQLKAKYETDGTPQLKLEMIKPANLDPVIWSCSLSKHVGAVSEKIQSMLDDYAERNPDGCLQEEIVNEMDPVMKKKREAEEAKKVAADAFQLLIWFKSMRTLVEPGEAVGAVAAQSIGEPSTQMTLNTFHLAGHGAVNVTLGIPRLRELIMTASQTIKTPIMTLFVPDGEKEAQRIARSLYRLKLRELLHSTRGIRVTEAIVQNKTGRWVRQYRVQLQFAELKAIERAFGVDWDELSNVIRGRWATKTMGAISRELKRSGFAPKLSAVEKNDKLDDERLGVKKVGRLNGGQRKKKKDAADVEDAESGDDNAEEDGTLRVGRKKVVEDDDESSSSDSSDSDEELEDGGSKSEVSDDGEKISQKTKSLGERNVTSKGLPKGTSLLEPRGQSVKAHPAFAGLFANDTQGWMELWLEIDPSIQKILLVSLIEGVLSDIDVRSTPGINNAVVLRRSDADGGGYVVQTEGVNLHSAWSIGKSVDLANLNTNDVGAVLRRYGVEAARNSIVEQVVAVFGVYGININPRHLGLVADYMTHQGGYKGMNRRGMESNSSPLLQMSYETTANFLTEACLYGKPEAMKSPSASIAMGTPSQIGTGVFSLRQPLVF